MIALPSFSQHLAQEAHQQPAAVSSVQIGCGLQDNIIVLSILYMLRHENGVLLHRTVYKPYMRSFAANFSMLDVTFLLHKTPLKLALLSNRSANINPMISHRNFYLHTL